jgi:cobalt-zinc-cadmium efflux system protein
VAEPAGHDGHAHGISAGADRRYLWTALVLILAFMAAEVAVGLVSGSLALLADAGHMTSDAAAIGLAIVAMRLAARPARGAYTFGLKRAEILSAMANGATLLGLAVFFAVESIRRLVSPPDVEGGLVLVVALVGIGVNLAATLVLRRANRQSLNVKGSYQHILTDLYAFIGTAIAGAVVLFTGWTRADAIASLLVAALMAKAGLALLRDSGRVVLQAAPAGLEPPAIGAEMDATTGVVEVHDLHVWEVTSGFPTLSAHVLVSPGGDCHGVRDQLEHLLADRFGITHTTLQVDHRSERPGDGHAHHDDPDCPTVSRR